MKLDIIRQGRRDPTYYKNLIATILTINDTQVIYKRFLLGQSAEGFINQFDAFYNLNQRKNIVRIYCYRITFDLHHNYEYACRVMNCLADYISHNEYPAFAVLNRSYTGAFVGFYVVSTTNINGTRRLYDNTDANVQLLSYMKSVCREPLEIGNTIYMDDFYREYTSSYFIGPFEDL